jgi:hypothetical protein
MHVRPIHLGPMIEQEPRYLHGLLLSSQMERGEVLAISQIRVITRIQPGLRLGKVVLQSRIVQW